MFTITFCRVSLSLSCAHVFLRAKIRSFKPAVKDFLQVTAAMRMYMCAIIQILNTEQGFPHVFALESLRINVARQPEVIQIGLELEY